MIHLILRGRPITKKNSSRIVPVGRGHRLLPSRAYQDYEKACMYQIDRPARPIDTPVNVCVLYYMPTKHRVDLVNLLEATDDILVAARVLQDDHSGVVAGHDGSRVLYDKRDPRAEIWIEDMEVAR